ncbi:hypothetical protein A2714_00515 [Candidatus Woesebacteria bacterium RIFCSPHIGHO2_01_FULL_38_9]|uniref:DegT/DnrJ/EryC1/StrS aminotransferase n=1 Tax=Candidatus Woesebacteria bacterium RIFCSPHIGHO2_01_FULL_38_9 TaxID=1802492 RepID=A0A1F7Y1U1_9BACT|nr:MAG: hypothetical protein A2714_00515 [Candidatus Woesebacteria bacterium RIFCSPHIGHO2_01_FULL_38_9]
MKRPIAISLSPNPQKDDVLLALKLLLSPIRWFDFRKTERLEKEFAKYFGNNYKALAVNSGRSALYLILKTLAVSGGEVALQALTCVAVPNSVLWLNAKPLYIDVDEGFNMDPNNLREKVSEKTKAIIVQHTFGMPADMDQLLKLARKGKIPVIEDCALSLGGKYKNKLLGTLGDVSFFSFGRDKVISSVFGGIILCRDSKLYEKLLEERDKLVYPGPGWVVQQLLHPILFSIILPLYNFGLGKLTIGKFLLFLLQKLGILSRAVYNEEKYGKRPKLFPTKMPGALAHLALNQLKKLESYNSHRKDIAKIYSKQLRKTSFKVPPIKQGSIWVRFPLLSDNALSIIECAKKKGVLLGDWYKDVVVPVADLSLVRYEKGSCPNAQKFAGRILNLPTYPTFSEDQAREVIRLIKACQSTKL